MRPSFGMIVWVHFSIFSYTAYASAFLTRPDLNPPTLTVHVNRLESTDKDLVFLTSYLTGHDAPLIYDLQGDLVWVGGKPGESAWHYHTHNLHTISYQGSPHLAYSEVLKDSNGLNTGPNLIMNNQYEVVAEFPRSDDITELDPHEFELIDSGTKLIQVGRIRHASDWQFAQDGVIGESVVQVVDTVTRNVEFEWRSLDHVPQNESCLSFPNLDYLHANSAVKDSDGNLLVSAYHACTIYKIDGTDGSILWRLGGENSDFVMLDGYHLMRMHHVRIRPIDSIKLPTALRAQVTDRTHLALSIFDNAFTGGTSLTQCAKSSAAIVILLDLVAMTGHIVERYAQPNGMFGALFGSVQFQPDGGRFIGWGGQRTVSQYTQDNELVYHAELADAAMPTFSYRAYKGPWVGRPTTKPDIFSYSWTCTWDTTMYASWNGATEVRSWRFFGAATALGPFKLAAIADKDGFETRAVASFFASDAYVEALQVNGSILGRSEIVSTRVPRPDYALICSEYRCYEDLKWTEADYLSNCSSNNSDMPGSVFDQAVLV